MPDWFENIKNRLNKQNLTLPFITKRAGKGLFLPPPSKPEKALARYKLRIAALTTGFIAIAGLLMMLAGHYASTDFFMIAAALIALCGLIAYDIVSRRLWENVLSAEMEKFSDYHDRLVREVARNRSEIAILKERLGETASIVKKQNSYGLSSGSAEARMIDTIVSQLSAMGEEPRPRIETPYDREVVALELAPPPKTKALPQSDLDAAMNGAPEKISYQVVIDLIKQAVRNDKIEIYEQPVVSLPQRKIRMKEIYARIHSGADGAPLPASRYMGLARREHLLPAIDNLLLLRCLQVLRAQDDKEKFARKSGGEIGRTPSAGRDVPYMLNISANTLHDKGFMGDLINFLSAHKSMASRIIFELPQAELESLEPGLVPILEGLSHLGCRFSMDCVRNRKIDINLLKSRQIKFLKLEAAWLLKESATRDGFSRISKLKKQLDYAGIDLIVEKIESEGSVRELLDFAIDYGEGYLFGKPDMFNIYNADSKAA